MKYKLAVLLFVLSSSCYSEAVRVGFGVGRGGIDLSPEFNEEGIDAGDTSVATSLYLGYIFTNKFVIDLTYGSITDDAILGANDNAHFDTYEFLVGYRFNFNKFYVEPKLGYAMWDLKLEEGQFLNPGPEYTFEDDGSDILYSLGTGYKFNDLFGMSISYKYIEFEYGDTDAVVLGFDFEL